MKFSTLLSSFQRFEFQGDLDFEVRGIACDSREVKRGDVFVCIKGLTTNGHLYLEEAVSRGARALVVQEKQGPLPGITQILVPDTRLALAQLSASFNNNPSSKLNLIGVTGTTGKTTTTYLIESLLGSAGRKTGLIGTVDYKAGEEKFPVKLTTPESLDLQQLFQKMLEKGVEEVAMEVSSHAIDLRRVDECQFNVLVFTNLSQDHLDYHHSLPEYFGVKKKLFEKNPQAFWVINIDDSYGRELWEISGEKVLSYGLRDGAQVRAENIEITTDGLTFDLFGPNTRMPLRSRLKGEFNLYNLLAAASVGIILNLSPEVIKEGLERLQEVPGRFEIIESGQDFTLVVDFAHTPDSLEKVLKAAREMTRERVITVFGCGGDRDRAKRPLMGQIAASLSDLAVITSDNPRGEDPEVIMNQIEQGLKSVSPRRYTKIADRREAIFEAVSLAKAGDLVLIAGKGHENYQIFKDKTVPFDDREIAKDALIKTQGVSLEG